ncbi:MAG: bifunctional histidinol-phosphatase/imidazoleglycerol-phosphate dehydratase HisB [Candidatus Marinimicrobia bacterium]|nr:bifunctional histidinol-phosphatase/imidazoleglycerol-phosphate dehydratase HisB [Candidatus Neomarinimicrobiota bacterium]
MKKLLIVDRDGTIIMEPPDEQIDSLEKLEFYPGVITNLKKIIDNSDFELIMVTNQDGLGTASFPEETFLPAHNKMLKILENEGIVFSDILIDRSFPGDNSPNRKPGTGMLVKYMNGQYNLAESVVIGDRKSDVQLAQNLKARSIYLSDEKYEQATLTTTSWTEIYDFLCRFDRKGVTRRLTRETEIDIAINLDGTGQYEVETGIGFFNHMLELFSGHSNIDLFIRCKGDLHVDAHHTIEDTAIGLGECFRSALGSKRGINRYGFLLPMDESLAQVALDFSGRPEVVWNVNFNREKLGEFPTEMFEHFFKSFAVASGCNMNIQAVGSNDHHKIEGVFKAFAHAIKDAVRRDWLSGKIPSTKGTL